MDLRSTLKHMLKGKKTSQLNVAKSMGCSRQWINKLIVRGDCKISDLSKIANALGYNATVKFVDKKDSSVIIADISADTQNQDFIEV